MYVRSLTYEKIYHWLLFGSKDIDLMERIWPNKPYIQCDLILCLQH